MTGWVPWSRNTHFCSRISQPRNTTYNGFGCNRHLTANYWVQYNCNMHLSAKNAVTMNSWLYQAGFNRTKAGIILLTLHRILRAEKYRSQRVRLEWTVGCNKLSSLEPKDVQCSRTWPSWNTACSKFGYNVHLLFAGFNRTLTLILVFIAT